LKLASVLALGISFASIANADVGLGIDMLRENGKTHAFLEHCGGQAHLSHLFVSGKIRPVLSISGVRNCSNISIDGVREGKLNQGINNEIVIFERLGTNFHTIRLFSNSAKSADVIYVETYKEIQQPPVAINPRANLFIDFGILSSIFGASQAVHLPECGGSAEVYVNDGQLTLTFRNVRSCSKFDILGANGEFVNYPTKSLGLNTLGEHTGSFTVPQKFIQLGGNSVKVVLRSNSGKHDEVILVRFQSL
jgi:hypothetical protein